MFSTRTLYGAQIASILLLFGLLFQKGACEEEIGSPLRVAQCRARCIQRFTKGASSQRSCLQGPDCHMCWENCQLLQSNYAVWGAICDEKGICFPGCKEACQFQKEGGQEGQRSPVIQTRGEEVIEVSEDGLASWPEPGGGSSNGGGGGPVVYVVMRGVGGGRWRQLTQTVERKARVLQATSSTLRVLVVNREGLLTIYSPLPPAPLASARAVLSTLGKDPLRRLGYPVPDLPPPPLSPPGGKRINTEILPTTHRPLSLLEDISGGSGRREDDPWDLREVSLIHQKVLVIAEIAWEPRSVGQRSVYFVTWEVDGGGLKGNLFTDSTCVTLSLWPNTVYHIQVELVRQDSKTERSEELVVDTSRAALVEVVGGGGSEGIPPVEPSVSMVNDGPERVAVPPAAAGGGFLQSNGIIGGKGGMSAELALGASAALALFLLLLGLAFLYSSRGRGMLLSSSSQSGSPGKLLPSPIDDRVFPPVVTVVGGGCGGTPPPQRTRTLHV